MLQFSLVRNLNWHALQDFGAHVVTGVFDPTLFPRVCGMWRRVLDSRVSNVFWNHKATLLAATASGVIGFLWRRCCLEERAHSDPVSAGLRQRIAELERQVADARTREELLQVKIKALIPQLASAEQACFKDLRVGAGLSAEVQPDSNPGSGGTSRNLSPERGSEDSSFETFLERVEALLAVLARRT